MSELVLASTSPYRRVLLDRLGIPYRVLAPNVDERALASGNAPDMTLALARAKADAGALMAPAAYVLGSDQAIEIDGDILGKPETPERALAQLERLNGREHRVVTAVVLRHPDGQSGVHVDVHHMRMRSLSRSSLAAYVAADMPLDCAGAYKIEGRGFMLFETMAGGDYTAVIGLPLLAGVTLLTGAGFDLLGGKS